MPWCDVCWVHHQRIDTVDVDAYMAKLRKKYVARTIAALAEEDLEVVRETLEKLEKAKETESSSRVQKR